MSHAGPDFLQLIFLHTSNLHLLLAPGYNSVRRPAEAKV